MILRDYDPARDREAVHRIWREVGWLEKGEEEKADTYVTCGRALVAEVAGAAECLVLTAPGSIRYLDEDLPFSGVTGVTTSRVARRLGLAKRLLARALAADAADGALVAGLGMFDQGFYNLLGFGTGGYEHHLAFDPADLTVSTRPRVPRRITPEDWREAHAARLTRRLRHGACNLTPPEITAGEMGNPERGFGLGYADGPDGELTHCFWCGAKDPENGPYHVEWMAYRTDAQLLELLALLKTLGDQVPLVRLREPKGIQLQDLLARPFRQRMATEKSRFEAHMRADAYWQVRVCDVPACLARTRLRGGPVSFNLNLRDPVERLLDDQASWRGVAGRYVVTLGPSSGAEPGHDAALPALSASVGAFSRLWIGALPATGIAVTDDLSGPPALLEALDEVLRLPSPSLDWDF